MAGKKGYYIQNSGFNIINFESMDKALKFTLRQKGENGDVAFIPSTQTEDPTLIRLLNRGSIVKASDGEIREKDTQEAEKAKLAEADTAALLTIDTSAQEALVERPCSALTKQGSKCKNKTYVTVGLAEGDPRPFFCGKHENESIDFYEQNEDGEWVLIVKE